MRFKILQVWEFSNGPEVKRKSLVDLDSGTSAGLLKIQNS